MNFNVYLWRLCKLRQAQGFSIHELQVITEMSKTSLNKILAMDISAVEKDYEDAIVKAIATIAYTNIDIPLTVENLADKLVMYYDLPVRHEEMEGFIERGVALLGQWKEDPRALYTRDEIELVKNLAMAHFGVLSMADICNIWHMSMKREITPAEAEKILLLEGVKL